MLLLSNWNIRRSFIANGKMVRLIRGAAVLVAVFIGRCGDDGR
jgi:hypothetical protein